MVGGEPVEARKTTGLGFVPQWPGQTTPKPKVCNSTRRLFKYLAERLDLRDSQHAIYDPQEKRHRPHHCSNEQLERHLNAPPGAWRDRLKSLTQRRLEEYRLGGPTIYLRPRFNNKHPTVLIRIDVDAHAGQPDAPALMEWLASHSSFGGKLYREPSTNGESGYATLILPRFTRSDGTHYTPRKIEINAQLDCLQFHLKQQAAVAGFKATVEVKGRYTIFGTLDNGTRTVTHRGSACRLPKCPNDDADIDRLQASEFPLSIIDRLMASQAAVQTSMPTIHPPAVSAPPKRTHRAQSRHIADTGDKHRNRCHALARAKLSIIGRDFDPDAITTDQVEQIISEADKLYADNGLATGERDKHRDDAFRTTLKWMLRTHDPDANGDGSDIWFDLEIDVPRAEELIRSRLSSAALWELQQAHKCGGAKITYSTMALALCTATKNALTTGCCPATAISGMLRYFHIRSNGSHVAIILKTLVKIGLLECTSISYKPGR